MVHVYGLKGPLFFGEGKDNQGSKDVELQVIRPKEWTTTLGKPKNSLLPQEVAFEKRSGACAMPLRPASERMKDPLPEQRELSNEGRQSTVPSRSTWPKKSKDDARVLWIVVRMRIWLHSCI